MLLRRPRGVYREALERTSALPGCVGAAATLELHAARFFPTQVEHLLSVALQDSLAARIWRRSVLGSLCD